MTSPLAHAQAEPSTKVNFLTWNEPSVKQLVSHINSETVFRVMTIDCVSWYDRAGPLSHDMRRGICETNVLCQLRETVPSMTETSIKQLCSVLDEPPVNSECVPYCNSTLSTPCFDKKLFRTVITLCQLRARGCVVFYDSQQYCDNSLFMTCHAPTHTLPTNVPHPCNELNDMSRLTAVLAHAPPPQWLPSLQRLNANTVSCRTPQLMRRWLTVFVSLTSGMTCRIPKAFTSENSWFIIFDGRNTLFAWSRLIEIYS